MLIGFATSRVVLLNIAGKAHQRSINFYFVVPHRKYFSVLDTFDFSSIKYSKQIKAAFRKPAIFYVSVIEPISFPSMTQIRLREHRQGFLEDFKQLRKIGFNPFFPSITNQKKTLLFEPLFKPFLYFFIVGREHDNFVLERMGWRR